MARQSGIIALMGSGELTATMVEVHKELLNRYGGDARAVFLDTPAGFQLNVDHLSRKAIDYFQNRVRHPLGIASLKSAESASAVETEQAYEALRKADYILIGPGSPTYALGQWRRTRVPQLITERIQGGGCLVAASAAALTVGALTLPVYEIYKVGQPPHWEPGLNILQTFGFDLVVLPHWNNAEGGNHDTRFCFMGAPRLRQLEDLLPAATTLVGLDEHTALVIDLAGQHAEVKGIGRVILRRQGRERVFGKQERIPLSLLRTGDGPAGPLHLEQNALSAAAPEQVPQDAVWDPLHAMGETIQSLIDRDRIEQATGTLLELERHIWDFHEELQERNAMGAAREVLRDMLVLMGSRLAQRPAGRKACLTPLVSQLLVLRARFREQKQWAAADQVRGCLHAVGVQIEDTTEGPRWQLEE